LAHEAMHAGSGARYVHRIVARHVSTPLSTAILRGELPKGSRAKVELIDGALVVRAA
jgi:ATP-dependent Clp protease ATP-binding subunit ClpA